MLKFKALFDSSLFPICIYCLDIFNLFGILDANYATIDTPDSNSNKRWKWYAEIDEGGNYKLNDEDNNEQSPLSKSHAIAGSFGLFAAFYNYQFFMKYCNLQPSTILLQY